jgi:hypothetical protein
MPPASPARNHQVRQLQEPVEQGLAAGLGLAEAPQLAADSQEGALPHTHQVASAGVVHLVADQSQAVGSLEENGA